MISKPPWKREHWKVRCSDESESVVAKILAWDESGCRQEDIDNINLIVAAPKLLNALKIAKFLLDGILIPGDSNIKIINKAIQEAEGK